MLNEAANIWIRALDAAQVNITIADATHPERPLKYVNRAFCDTTGYTAEEVVGRSCRFLQGPNTSQNTIAQIRQSLDRGEALDVEILNYRRDGSEFWNALSLTPIRDDAGHLTAIVGFQVDVTERKMADEDRFHAVKMEALGRFSSGTAHEVNSLLQPIVSLPSLIAPALPVHAEEEREWLGLIEQHGKSARQLLRKLLNYGRRHTDEVRGLFDPLDAIRKAAEHLKSICNNKVELVLDWPSTTSGFVHGDSQSLQHSLIAIGENAFEAMPEGGTLQLTASFSNTAVTISVADTGPGVDNRLRHKVFEPFFTGKPIGQGTGLGLALAYSYVTSMNGTISLVNRRDSGACFTINLPLAASEPVHLTQEINIA